MDGPSTRLIVAASIIVFLIALLLRIPSCYESFWVDELHSAWCVWGDLGEVADRAEIGHQSPFYFIFLWFWKQAAGGSELALRLSSVLAVATSCVVLTVGVAKLTRSLSAGIASGLILAIENNSIFFGTEVRPFAFVILLGSIATIGFARLATLNSRHDDRLWWISMIVAILLAGLCQPTSLGVLIWLPIVLVCLWMVRDRRQLFRITLTDGLLLVAVTAAGFALWSITLSDSWGQKQAWASFASATSVNQIWLAWDWVSLWCLPLFVLAMSRLSPVAFRSAKDADTALGGSGFAERKTTLLVAAIALFATFGYWFVAWMEWLPLWHRRYFIAVLPMLAFIVGGSVASVANVASIRKFAPLVSSCLIGAIAYQQNLHRSLPNYPVALVKRGEDWRAAVDWVRTQSDPIDSVYLESGLIEWGRSMPKDETHISYFLFPISGPYQPEQSVAVINPDLELPYHSLYDDTKGIFLVVRRPKSQIPIDPTKWGWVYGNRYLGEVKSFGNVTVVWMPTLEGDKGR